MSADVSHAGETVRGQCLMCNKAVYSSQERCKIGIHYLHKGNQIRYPRDEDDPSELKRSCMRWYQLELEVERRVKDALNSNVQI